MMGCVSSSNIAPDGAESVMGCVSSSNIAPDGAGSLCGVHVCLSKISLLTELKA